MINVLVRSHKRPIEFRKCIASVAAQNYKKIHVIVSTHDEETEQQSHKTLTASGLSFEMIRVKNNGEPYSWNLHCNDLKAQVKQGWFFYLDSDDWISKRISLNAIAQHLTNPNIGVICQYLRGRKAKPSTLVTRHDKTVDPESIIKGRIGGSAIFLHHTHKDLAMWDGNRAADYRFIKAISEKIPLKFVPIPVVQTGNSGRHGS